MTPSQNVTINLINRLVQRGALTQEDADDLIRQAENDAAVARAQAAATPAPAAASDTGAPADDDTVRVTYVPEVVRAQLRDEIKQQVMAQARAENWAAPRTFPDWVSHFRPFGDFRVRHEDRFFPDGNDNTGAFPNFNAINTGAPFDVSGTVFSPQINVDQDRNAMRLRARFGTSIDLGDNFFSGLRIVTGESNSPVSPNQSFGATGGFSKYAIWLDRAFVRYDWSGAGEKSLQALAGRFDNPFFSTDLIWDDDLGFDGLAVQARGSASGRVRPFVAGGLFPVYNTDYNFSSIQPAKFKSNDKWLYAVQAGSDVKLATDLNLKLGAAWYEFVGIDGNLSTPFTPITNQDAGDTDIRRPAFAQKGNTYMALRSIVPNALNDYGTKNQWQYFGLATAFREAALTGRLDYDGYAPFRISLTGEFVQNTAFKRGAVAGQAVNNLGAIATSTGLPQFVGGDSAWNVQLKIGRAALEKRWDWTAGLGYRYVESDAVVDGFCDSDFGGGGTNLEGYTIQGALALSSSVALGFRWMSASQVAGPTYKNDILQVDLNAHY